MLLGCKLDTEHAGATMIAPTVINHRTTTLLTSPLPTTTATIVQHQIFLVFFHHICFALRLNNFLILFYNNTGLCYFSLDEDD